MDKCHQDKCCQDKCHYDSWHLSKMVQGTYFWSLIKIQSVTADIFLIWTNVTWTNVAWTNVTLTLGICSTWSQEPTFKVLSKSVESCYGQMSHGQMLPGQMSLWHLESVEPGPLGPGRVHCVGPKTLQATVTVGICTRNLLHQWSHSDELSSWLNSINLIAANWVNQIDLINLIFIN